MAWMPGLCFQGKSPAGSRLFRGAILHKVRDPRIVPVVLNKLLAYSKIGTIKIINYEVSKVLERKNPFTITYHTNRRFHT